MCNMFSLFYFLKSVVLWMTIFLLAWCLFNKLSKWGTVDRPTFNRLLINVICLFSPVNYKIQFVFLLRYQKDVCPRLTNKWFSSKSNFAFLFTNSKSTSKTFYLHDEFSLGRRFSICSTNSKLIYLFIHKHFYFSFFFVR